MISRRATAVTASSIRALSKVCYRSSYANSIKVAPFGKSLSTATEAYPYYQNPVGNDRNDSSPDLSSKDRDFSGRSLNTVSRNELIRTPVGYGGNWDTSSNTVGRDGQNGGGNSGGGGQIYDRNDGRNWQNYSGHGVGNYQQNWDGYKWSNAEEGLQNFRERPANLNGGNREYVESRDASYQGGHGGHMHNGSVGHLSGNVGGVRSDNGGAFNQNGAYVPKHEATEQRMSSKTNGTMSNFGQHQPQDNKNYAPDKFGQHQQPDNNNHVPSHFEQCQPAYNNSYTPSNFGPHQPSYSNGNATSNFGQHQPSYSNSNATSNFGQNQPSYNHSNAPSNFGQHQPSYNNNNVASSFGQHQPSYNDNNPPSSFGQHQPVYNNSYAPNVGAYQQTAAQNIGNVRPQVVNPYLYPEPNVAGHQQNPYANLIYNRNAVTGPLQSNATAPYPGTSSQVPGHSSTDMNSTDALETQQIVGTIEELERYTKEGKLKEAMEVLELLEKNQVRLIPERDMSTVVMLIEACGEAQAEKEAKILHKALLNLMAPLTLSTCNKILDMYLKCGSIEEAYSLFNEIPNGDLTTWDTMIRGLVKNDLGEEAIDIFTEFKNSELKPDGQIFLGVFTACSIVGDVTEGMLHFQSMSKQYGIIPSMQHYVGVVEMLGYAGYLDNALEFIENMPVKPTVDVWETLMHVSRIQGNVELGDHCAELVDKLDPSRLSEQSKAGLIPLKASDIEKEKEKKKQASRNLLEVRSRVHEYRAGDTSHPENDRIYALLRGLKTQMKEAGYIPELRGVLHDIDPEGKEDALLAHSERLAAAYGFLTTAARQPIRVIKNLRVCVDCHNALKIISNLVGRELIMRDAKRFHHFKDGVCSCKDYW